MIKGYLVSAGYMGWVDSCSRFILFPTEKEYLEFVKGE